MLKGRKQIDGIFVDSKGRVVSTISARYLQNLIEQNQTMEEALRKILWNARRELSLSTITEDQRPIWEGIAKFADDALPPVKPPPSPAE